MVFLFSALRCIHAHLLRWQIQRVRGMPDWLPATSKRNRYFVDVFHWVAELYNFGEVRRSEYTFSCVV